MNTQRDQITAVILAGGRGRRMEELTEHQQKCLLPVDGKPILEHILFNLSTTFSSVNAIIVTEYEGEKVREMFGSQYHNISIEYVQSPPDQETKGGLLAAEAAVEKYKTPFLYIAGDVITHPALFEKVVEKYEAECANGILGVLAAATDHTPALGHAVIGVDQTGHATEMIFPALPEWDATQLREIGVAYHHPAFFQLLRNSRPDQIYISHVIRDAIPQNINFAVETYSDKWYHFVEPKDLQTHIEFSR